MNSDKNVRSQSANVFVETGSVRLRAAVAGRVEAVVRMPLEWMVQAYIDALGRYRSAAAESQGNSMRLSIALFELCSWLDSLKPRIAPLEADAHVKGLTFVRNRTHHAFAAAVYFDAETNEWTWRSAANFPKPTDRHHENRQLERCYTAHLAERPVLQVLERIEHELKAHGPNPDSP